jgi:hypothetical protein
MKIGVFLFAMVYANLVFSQSFNEEKTSMINYIKRMYNSSPFEGARLIEGDQVSYYVAAISLSNSASTPKNNNSTAEKKAQEAAKITFAEPCVRFEMLSMLSDSPKKITYLFSFQPLSEFIKVAYKKQAFNGAKIISAPKCNYFVSVIALSPSKYTSESMMDRVALIKAKQQANTLFNGSTISSDIIIKTDEASSITTSSEIIREQSMGFVEGLESLLKYTEGENKVYIFYSELLKK